MEQATIQTVPTALLQLTPVLRQRAVELQSAGTATALSALQTEFAELEATAKLASVAEQAKNEAS